MLSFLLVILIAAAVTAAASAGVLYLSRRFTLVSAPRDRDVHQHPTPRLGGVAMGIGILATVWYALARREFHSVVEDREQLFALIGACVLITVVGVLDDLFDLDWMVKLAAQLVAAAVLAWNGAQIVSLPFGNTLIVGSPTVNLALTVLLMTLVMNAMNFVDGLDGLVVGVAIISNLTFLIYTQLLIAHTGVDASITFAALIAAIVIGICVGFLPYNWHRARMFMGDTGALLIGLLMATSTVLVTGRLNPAQLDQKLVLASYIPIILPVAVLALPLADFTLAVLRRIHAGKSPFHADRQHLHHRLLDLGHSPIQVVLIFYLWSMLISLACLLVFTTQSFFWPTIVVCAGGVVCAVVTAIPLNRVRRHVARRASCDDGAARGE